MSYTDFYDDLSERLGQLSSLLCIASSEEFHGYSLLIKNNYLWLASNLVDKCVELTENHIENIENEEFIKLYQQLTSQQQVIIKDKIELMLVKQVQS